MLDSSGTGLGMGSACDHLKGGAKNVLFTVSFLQNCAQLSSSLSCSSAALAPAQISWRVSTFGDVLKFGARFTIGWMKLARRLKHLSAFSVIPLVGASERFMIVVERCCNRVSHLCSWTIGRSTREAQRSFNRVASCHDAGPFAFDTKLRLRETADHS